jgi:hypothetical protein
MYKDLNSFLNSMVPSLSSRVLVGLWRELAPSQWRSLDVVINNANDDRHTLT